MFPQFTFKALAASSMLFAAGSMASPVNQTGAALVDIPIPTPIVEDWKISATMDTTGSWTETEVHSTVAGDLPTMVPTKTDTVVKVTIPEAAAAAALAAAEVAAENGIDADHNHNLAFDWDFSAGTYQHPPAPNPNVQAAAAADSGGDDSAPAAAASSAPAKNKYPTSPAGGIVKWFKSIFDFLSGRTYWKAHHKHKEMMAAHAAKEAAAKEAAAAAKAQADADAANAENVSEEWTFDDPDYNGDSGEMVGGGPRRVRLFRV